jgi:hypothetical protein
MRCLNIAAARLAPKVRSLQVSFRPPLFDEPIPHFLQPHRTAAAIVAAIVISSCCSETNAQQAIVAQTGDGPADSISVFSAEASQRFGLPAPWIRAVIRSESAGNLHAVSPTGAMGLMQIVPQTWSDLRRRYRLGADPYDAHDNIIAGTAYLRELQDRYGSPGFLAAYNAGPVRWEEHLVSGKPLPLETQDFLVKLSRLVGRDAIGDAVLNATSAPSCTDAPLFPTLPIQHVERQPSDIQFAGRALHGQRICARFDGPRAATEWTVRCPDARKTIAMSVSPLYRAVEGSSGGLLGSAGKRKRPTDQPYASGACT